MRVGGTKRARTEGLDGDDANDRATVRRRMDSGGCERGQKGVAGWTDDARNGREHVSKEGGACALSTFRARDIGSCNGCPLEAGDPVSAGGSSSTPAVFPLPPGNRSKSTTPPPPPPHRCAWSTSPDTRLPSVGYPSTFVWRRCEFAAHTENRTRPSVIRRRFGHAVACRAPFGARRQLNS